MVGFNTYYCGCGAVQGECDCFSEENVQADFEERRISEVTCFYCYACDNYHEIVISGDCDTLLELRGGYKCLTCGRVYINKNNARRCVRAHVQEEKP
jgi:hypothetical protein